jgi:hypothetical protein
MLDFALILPLASEGQSSAVEAQRLLILMNPDKLVTTDAIGSGNANIVMDGEAQFASALQD